MTVLEELCAAKAALSEVQTGLEKLDRREVVEIEQQIFNARGAIERSEHLIEELLRGFR